MLKMGDTPSDFSHSTMFIVLEGIDGSGTTTQANLLSKALFQKNITTFLTAEPTDRSIGKFIRTALSGERRFSPRALQLLFCADREEHLCKEILPALRKGETVLCDRYTISTIAYSALSGDMNFFSGISAFFPEPDLTIFLTISVENALKRIAQRSDQRDIFEQQEKLEIIAKEYDRQMERISEEKKLILDAMQSPEEIHQKIWNRIFSKKNS